MKEIIKNGRIEHKETYPLFTCPRCNCEFYGTEMPQDYEKVHYLDENDPWYNTAYRKPKIKYISTCPCCENPKVEHNGSSFYTKITYIEGEENIKNFLKEPQKGQFSCLK